MDRAAALPAFSDEPVRAAHRCARRQRWRVRRARLGTALWIAVTGALLLAGLTVLGHARLEPTTMDPTRNRAFELGKALELYKLQTGAFPNRLERLTAPPRGKPILGAVPTDEWGRPFLYLKPGLQNPAKFDVRSAGADGVWFTSDDVGNWPESG